MFLRVGERGTLHTSARNVTAGENTAANIKIGGKKDCKLALGALLSRFLLSK